MRLEDIDVEEMDEEIVKDDFKLLNMGKIDRDKLFVIEAAAGIVLLVVLIVIAAFLLFGKQNRSDDVNETKEKVASLDSATASDLKKDIKEEDVAPNNLEERVDEINKEEVAKADATELNRTIPAKGELPQTYTAGQMLNYTKDTYQLPELYAYWDNYQLDAVADLIRLDRVRTITDALGKSNDYYYYGGTDSNGRPDGKGLAVYAYDTYYFGEWNDGKREGTGMWIRLFANGDGVVNGIRGVKEHQYNGSWYNDLPNGPGQEHIDYDNDQIDKEFVITNAIGEFRDGYYHGDMYIMTIDKNGRTIDWYGSSEKGSFTFINDKKTNLGKRCIWKAGEGYSTDEEDDCRWIMPKDNADFGVAGLKK